MIDNPLASCRSDGSIPAIRLVIAEGRMLGSPAAEWEGKERSSGSIEGCLKCEDHLGDCPSWPRVHVV